MAAPSKTLNIDIANSKTAIEEWASILERTHSWAMPQRVTIGPSAASSAETEHDMITIGDSRLRDSNGLYAGSDFEIQVLIDFLRNLSSLCDLEWQVDDLLMPPLFQFLRDELPSCNLHLKPFHIPYDAEPAYVRSILRLPSVRTIWFKRNFHGAVEKIIQHMARASDGNVREVRIFWSEPGASPFGEPIPLMWDQELAAPDGQRRGQVQCLQLTGIQGSDGINLETWARHTDFSHLHALSLEMHVTEAALETLIDLPLQSLHSLGMLLDASSTSHHYSATLQNFICTLPSLSRLRLTGAVVPLALKAILSHLDSTLHTLYLVSGAAFDSTTIALVADRCTYVQDLSINNKRAWNKPGEDIAVLKALGRMPHLSNLHLTFDASDPTLLSTCDKAAEPTSLAPSEPSFSAFDTEPFPTDFMSGKKIRNGHIRDALINSAIDAQLAKAVFSTILSGAPDGETPSLRRLSLKAAGGGHFGVNTTNGGVTEIVEEVGREWIVERSDHDDVLEACRVEVDDEWFELCDELSWDVEPVFRSIWPGEGNWFDEWHAVSLV